MSKTFRTTFLTIIILFTFFNINPNVNAELKSKELFYDDGFADVGVAWNVADGGFAVEFDNPYTRTKIVKIKFQINGTTSDYNPIQIRILYFNKKDIIEPIDYYFSKSDVHKWIYVDVSEYDIIVGKYFYVAIEQKIKNDPDIASDTDPYYEKKSYSYRDDHWKLIKDANYMIRAYVIDADEEDEENFRIEIENRGNTAEYRGRIYEKLSYDFKNPGFKLYDEIIVFVNDNIFISAINLVLPQEASLVLDVLEGLEQESSEIGSSNVEANLASEYMKWSSYAKLYEGQYYDFDESEVKQTYLDSGFSYGFDVFDHISTELAFMSFLANKENDAWLIKDYSEANYLREIQKSFLENHLLKWIPLAVENSFCESGINYYLEESDESDAYSDFYLQSFELLDNFLEGEEIEFTKDYSDEISDTSENENDNGDEKEEDNPVPSFELLSVFVVIGLFIFLKSKRL